MKFEDEAEHECNIQYLAQEDDDYKSLWREGAAGLKAVTDSSDSVEITFAALKEPIKGSHLGKRVRHSEGGSTDMDPIVTEFYFICQGGPWDISGGTHTQIII